MPLLLIAGDQTKMLQWRQHTYFNRCKRLCMLIFRVAAYRRL